MSESKPKHDIFTHEPLPYVVRLRETLAGDDDAVPQIREERVTAYSVMEAMLQAIFLAGGTGVEDSRYRVESIGLDLPAYIALVRETAAMVVGIRSQR